MRIEDSDGYDILCEDVLLFRCLYQENGEINKRTFWSGGIIKDYNRTATIKENAGIYDLEGIIADFQSTRPQERYLTGIAGMNRVTNRVDFTICPTFFRESIDYMFKYDEEDKVSYGVWFLVNEKENTSKFGGYARLEIEDYINVKPNDILNHVYKCKAYYEHAEEITNLVRGMKPTIMEHDEVDDDTFEKAKSYFKKNEKTLKYIFKHDED